MVADCWRVSLVAFNIKASLIYFYISFFFSERYCRRSLMSNIEFRESLSADQTLVFHIYIYIFSYIVLGIIVFALNKKYD